MIENLTMVLTGLLTSKITTAVFSELKYNKNLTSNIPFLYKTKKLQNFKKIIFTETNNSKKSNFPSPTQLIINLV